MVEKHPKLTQLEVDVRERLRNVQLVCELGTDSEDQVFTECHDALNAFLASSIQTPIRQLNEVCPAVLVLVLTVIGAQLGTGGQLWEPIMREGSDGLNLIGLDGSNSGAFGEQYRLSLQMLGLPEFAHLQRRRNLGPILLHAGIPVQSSAEVWQKIFEFVQNGVSSGREIVQDLRGDSSQIRYFKKPAQSFVNESGAFAVDVVQRMVNVVIASAEDAEISAELLATRHGLPPKLVEAFFHYKDEAVGATHHVPSATVLMDIDSGMGPYCLLPPIHQRNHEYWWSVCGRNFRASGFEENVIQLEPIGSWPVEVMENGRRIRARRFNTLAPEGAWLFVESGSQLRLIQHAGEVEEGIYFLLVAKGLTIRVMKAEEYESAAVADAAGLGNSWSKFDLYELNLVGASKVSLESADGSKTNIEVLSLPLRPQLAGLECRNIRETDGFRIFSKPPRIVFSGNGGEISQFNVAIRNPDGVWFQSSSVDLNPINNEISLDQFIEWETGDYRIEVIGPLGSGLSEKFVVLLNGKLEVEERIFAPNDTVRAVLVFQNSKNSDFSRVEAVFSPGKDRIFLKSSDNSVLIEARVPRVAFDIGGIGSPPDFSRSTARVLTVEDLAELRELQLQIRTGKPAQLQLILRDQEGRVFHDQVVNTTGPNGYGTVEVSSLLDSIRQMGTTETQVEICVENQVSLVVLTVQQALEFQIVSTSFELSGESISGELLLTITAPSGSPEAQVCLQSRERVWEPPVFFPIPARQDDSESQIIQISNVYPGAYSLGISVGRSNRLIPSSRRYETLGTEEEIQMYSAALQNDSEKLAEQVVFGVKLNRSNGLHIEEVDVQRVVHFLLLNQRVLSTNSSVFSSCVDLIAREGHTRIVADWLTRIGAEMVTVRDIEHFVLRLFPLFVDDPLTDVEDAQLVGNDVDHVLASRLWALSPMVGLIFTFRLNQQIVDEMFLSLGQPRETLNYEELAELTWPAIRTQVSKEVEFGTLFSRGFGLKHFLATWEQCWPNGPLDEPTMSKLDDWCKRGMELMTNSAKLNQTDLPPKIAETMPVKLRSNRKIENLRMAKFVHNLFRTAWIAARAETPMNVALSATEILGESYGFAKGLSDRALALALLIEKPRSY